MSPAIYSPLHLLMLLLPFLVGWLVGSYYYQFLVGFGVWFWFGFGVNRAYSCSVIIGHSW